MVDMGSAPAAAAPEDAAKSAVSALISGVVGARGGPKPKAAAAGLLGSCLEEARGVLGAQLWAVMHHPEFQRTEATWRGLKFLLRKCNFRKGMQLDLLDVRREEQHSKQKKRDTHKKPTKIFGFPFPRKRFLDSHQSSLCARFVVAF